MHIALVAPPFIPVPPVAYGGTELFVAHLAEGLSARGHDVIVYANGESRVSCETRWRYAETDWPPRPGSETTLKSIDHAAWSVADIAGSTQVIWTVTIEREGGDKPCCVLEWIVRYYLQ